MLSCPHSLPSLLMPPVLYVHCPWNSVHCSSAQQCSVVAIMWYDSKGSIHVLSPERNDVLVKT
jgi:hypothetical protein